MAISYAMSLVSMETSLISMMMMMLMSMMEIAVTSWYFDKLLMAPYTPPHYDYYHRWTIAAPQPIQECDNDISQSQRYPIGVRHAWRNRFEYVFVCSYTHTVRYARVPDSIYSHTFTSLDTDTDIRRVDACATRPSNLMRILCATGICLHILITYAYRNVWKSVGIIIRCVCGYMWTTDSGQPEIS